MCFTNLPIEVDEDGDPYIADEIDRPAESTDPDADATGEDGNPDLETYGCLDDDPDVPIAQLEDEERFDEVMETLPDDARAAIEAEVGTTESVDGEQDGTPESRTIAAGR